MQGAGPLGLYAVAARDSGARTALVIGAPQSRLMAVAFGASAVFDIEGSSDTAERVAGASTPARLTS